MTQPYDPNQQRPNTWQPPQAPGYPPAGRSHGEQPFQPHNGSQPPYLSQPYSPPSYALPPAKKKSSALPWVIGVVMALIAALVGGAWFVWGRTVPADPPTSPPASVLPSGTAQPSGSLTELTAAKPTVTGSTVGTQCFSLTMPTGYVVFPNETPPCSLSINIPKGDALTQVVIARERNTKDADEFIATAPKKMPTGLTFVRSEIVQRIGLKIGLIEVKDSSGLTMRVYYLPQRGGTPKWSYQGQAVTGYTIMGYAYNSGLVKNLDAIVDSLYQR